ncbi:MAG TPA: hypothetical protein PK771_08190 [Spirochaetota bacterium]|nr:hypothetical protein [Spirochaetota bacterium]
MEQLTNPILIDILKKNREYLNRLYVYASQSNPAIDEKIFLGYIKNIIEKIIIEVDCKDEKKCESFTLLFYQNILDLYKINLLNNQGKYPDFEVNLLRLIFKFKSILFENPDFFVELANSLYNINTKLKSQTDKWVDILLKLPYNIEIDIFKKFSLITGWSLGYAFYRESAIKYISEIPSSYLQLIFDIEPKTINEKIDNLKNNLWYSFSEDVNPNLKITGDFSGYAGIFNSQPIVFLTDDGIIATDNTNSYFLYYDSFGVMFQKISLDAHSQNIVDNNKKFYIDNNGKIFCNDKEINFKINNLFPVSSYVSTKDTLCFTLSNSFKIFLVGINC